MNDLLEKILKSEYSRENFIHLSNRIFKNFNKKEIDLSGVLSDEERAKVESFTLLGTAKVDGKALHVIEVELKSDVESSPVFQRNIVGKFLKTDFSDIALVAYYTKGGTQWKIAIVTNMNDDQVLKRFFFIVGHPNIHTAISQLRSLIDHDNSIEDLIRAFSIEPVTKKFYTEISNWYFWALKHVRFPRDAEEVQNGRNIAVIRFITRIMFVWFMKQKGLIKDELFDEQKINELLKDFSYESSTYYKAILQNLFFATLNTPIDERDFRTEERPNGFWNSDYMNPNKYRYQSLFKDPGKMKDLFNYIPFLNGGLFECLDKGKNDPSNNTSREIRIDGFSDVDSKQPIFPNFLFFTKEKEVDLNEDYGTKNKKYLVKGIINILKSYNFTVEESTPVDQEIALDPELLGKVFENLLASYNPETATTARKATGSYYTPREIVNYMVDESLKEYFKSKLKDNIDNFDEKLKKLFSYSSDENPLTDFETDLIIQAIDSLKVIDPAVGSGAFLMAMLQRLVFLLSKLDPNNAKWKDQRIKEIESNIKDPYLKNKLLKEVELNFSNNELDYARKLYLIQKSLYGVDIQPIAIQIAKLRFFISLLIDQKVNKTDPKNNYGISPLPNLETKLVIADSLLKIDIGGLPLRSKELIELEEQVQNKLSDYFFAYDKKRKDEIEEEYRGIIRKIKSYLERRGFPSVIADNIISWNPFNTNVSSGWFEPFLMFGIRDGFDIVIGNPPYGDLLKEDIKNRIKEDYQNSTMTEIASPFLERGVNLLRDHGTLTYIITYAITFSKDFSKNRNQLRNNFREVYIYTFDRDRCRIFESMSQSVSIVKCFDKNSQEKRGIFTSRMFREIDDIRSIKVSRADDFLLPKGSEYFTPHRLPKIGEEINKNILANLFIFKKKLREVIGKEYGEKLWIRTSGNYWYNAWDREPYKSSEIKNIFVEKPYYRFLLLLINSSLFYFWFRIYGDGRHMNMDILEEMPIPEESLMITFQPLINKASTSLMDSIFSVFDKKRERFETSKIKDKIDLVDLVLGKFFYNLSFEEILHIMNYDWEVRGGTKLSEPLRSLIEEIISMKEKNPGADISSLESQIDQLVYQLYGLTNEEIAVIEGSNLKNSNSNKKKEANKLP